MDCKQARQEIAITARPEDATPALAAHTLQCDACRVLLAERTALHAAYAQLREETAAAGPSARVEEFVQAALHHRMRKRPQHRTGRQWALAGAVASLFLAAVLLARHHAHLESPAHVAAAPEAAAVDDRPFTAVPYVVPPAPYERTAVVRTEVPLQVMLAAGFEVRGGEPGAGLDAGLGSSTKADVLYGEDGRILAIRLVAQPQNISTKRMD